jgi:hypothetical protein
MESRRTRVEFRTDAETRQRLTEYIDQSHRKLSDVATEAMREYLDSKQPANPAEATVKRLEKELEDCGAKFEKLQKLKGVGGLNEDDAFYLADFLSSEAYKDLNEDWQKIRLRFLEDFNSDPRPGWIRQWGITEESQIIDVCRLAFDLREARVKRDELRQRLNTLYRTLGRGEQVKEEAATEKPKLETSGKSEVPS